MPRATNPSSDDFGGACSAEVVEAIGAFPQLALESTAAGGGWWEMTWIASEVWGTGKAWTVDMVLIGLTSMTSSSASEVIGGGGDTLVDGGGDACVDDGSGNVLLPTPEKDPPREESNFFLNVR